MRIMRNIISAVTAIALAVAFVGVGFLACVAPPVTSVLANLFSDDATSPFNRTQLVHVADATRDYSFGAHDKQALYRAIYQVDLQLRQEIANANGTIPYAFPDLDAVNDASDAAQFEEAFSGASEMYCFSADTVAHLDDCYDIARIARIALVAVALAALVSLVFCGVTCRKRRVGGVLMAAGIVVIVAFAGLGAWAAVDFDGFFRTFHQLFFSQGSWIFPYDSLLICALPTEFWMGMGFIWLAVALIVSALSIVVGRKARK